jgi:hypothetical protein
VRTVVIVNYYYKECNASSKIIFLFFKNASLHDNTNRKNAAWHFAWVAIYIFLLHIYTYRLYKLICNKWTPVTYEESYIVWNICVLNFRLLIPGILNTSTALNSTALHVHFIICSILNISPTFRQLLLIRGQQEPKGLYVKHLSQEQNLLYL